MLGLAMIATLMGFLVFWGYECSGPLMRRICMHCAGYLGFMPILAPGLVSSANPLQQRWGLRPVANCGMGG